MDNNYFFISFSIVITIRLEWIKNVQDIKCHFIKHELWVSGPLFLSFYDAL